MNTLQLATFIVYMLTLIGYLYFSIRAKRRWLRDLQQGKAFATHNRFAGSKFVFVAIAIVFYFIIKWAGVHYED